MNTDNAAIRLFGEDVTLIYVTPGALNAERTDYGADAETRVTAKAVVQPITDAVLRTLEEGKRWDNFRSFFVAASSTDDLNRIAWDGHEWLVSQVKSWRSWFNCVGERQGR